MTEPARSILAAWIGWSHGPCWQVAAVSIVKLEDGIIWKESPMAKLPNDDYDGAWKAALGVYLQEFLALCFPAIHAAIDWARPYRFLETELLCAGTSNV
jgi:hypothetical protein